MTQLATELLTGEQLGELTGAIVIAKVKHCYSSFYSIRIGRDTCRGYAAILDLLSMNHKSQMKQTDDATAYRKLYRST